MCCNGQRAYPSENTNNLMLVIDNLIAQSKQPGSGGSGLITITQTLGPGTTALAAATVPGKWKAYLNLAGTSLQASFSLTITRPAGGGKAELSLDESSIFSNTSNYQVTFDSDSSGRLLISCPTFPAAGLPGAVTAKLATESLLTLTA
ncbi:hypothetical protein CLV58_12569 [Spirosoma oryzae]|uniref:Uncharacterized protein n=1 Tax=Spirosoma oryzae TaxID=1469603 RepID=A0A2T0S8P4_9BACT|nr:hypothetical protein [Spirosoma oryzae]PRY29807.1 hypothetical protein CLV58_12569 [Spirosoma oryzae]